MDSELSASSDEEDCATMVGARTSVDLEDSSDHETPKQLDTPSSGVAELEGVPVRVCSSSN